MIALRSLTLSRQRRLSTDVDLELRLPIGALHALSLGLILALLAVGCSRIETPKVTPVITTVHIATDEAALPLLHALTDAYTHLRPTVVFELEPGNAETAAEAAFMQQADIAAVTRLPASIPGRSGPWVADLAMDAVSIVVNPTDPITNASLQILRNIFSGAATSWGDVGIADRGDIDVGVREAGDGARARFDEVVMGDTKLSLSAVVLPSIDVTMNFVAYQANAIAYVPGTRITSTVTPAVKVLSVEGQYPTAEAIASGQYRLSRTLNLIAATEPQGLLREFVSWALGEEAQSIITSLHYVQMPQAQK